MKPIEVSELLTLGSILQRREDAYKLQDKTIISRAAKEHAPSAAAIGESRRARALAISSNNRDGIRMAHKSAGEKHLEAAAHHGSGEVAEAHKRMAADHAAMAGSAWDEDTHPRDENGKFA